MIAIIHETDEMIAIVQQMNDETEEMIAIIQQINDITEEIIAIRTATAPRKP